MLITKKIRNIFIGVLFAPVSVFAQQGPLITVHNDEKPAYISPFDKPQQVNIMEKAATAVISAKAAPVTQENVVANIPTHNPVSAPTEPVIRKTTPDVKKTDGTRKAYRQYNKSRNRARAAQLKEAHSPEVVPPTALDVTKGSSVKQAASSVTAGTATVITAAAISNDRVSGGSQPRIPEETGSVVHTSGGSKKHTQTVASIDAEPKIADKMQQHALSADVAVMQQQAPTNIKVAQTLQSKKPLNIDNTMFGLSLLSQMLLAGMSLVLVIMGYAIKVMVFKKDPALTDPWFKPAK